MRINKGRVLKAILQAVMLSLVPADFVARFVLRHSKRHLKFTMAVVFVIELMLVATALLLADDVARWLQSLLNDSRGLIVDSILTGYSIGLFGSFNASWHHGISRSFAEYSLTDRLDVMQIGKFGSRALFLTFLPSVFVIAIDLSKITTVPLVPRTIMLSIYWVGIYALRIKLPREAEISTIFEAINTLETLPMSYGVFCVKFARNLVKSVVQNAFPAMNVDFDKVFDCAYSCQLFGDSVQKSVFSGFLNQLKALVSQNNGLAIINLVTSNAQALQSSLLSCPFMSVRFKWEKVDFWNTAQKWAFPLIIVASIASIIPFVIPLLTTLSPH